MARVLSFLIRYVSNYYTLHRSDLAVRAAPLDPRLVSTVILILLKLSKNTTKINQMNQIIETLINHTIWYVKNIKFHEYI